MIASVSVAEERTVAKLASAVSQSALGLAFRINTHLAPNEVIGDLGPQADPTRSQSATTCSRVSGVDDAVDCCIAGACSCCHTKILNIPHGPTARFPCVDYQYIGRMSQELAK